MSTSRPDLHTLGVPKAHRAPNNHVGRRHVQRSSGGSGPVTRYIPGTPEYDALMAQRGLRYRPPEKHST